MNRKLFFVLLLAAMMLPGKAFAQNFPANVDAGAIERNSQKNMLQPQDDPMGKYNKSTEDSVNKDDVTSKPAGDNVSDKNASVLVNAIDVSPSEILSKDEIEKLTAPLVGRKATISDLNSLVESINKLYTQKGFITARAFLPPQNVNNGVIQVKLVEGHIGQINVEGNRFTKTNYIKGKMTQEPGELLKLSDLERDILKFNRNNTLALKANLKPGKEFGTTDVNLVAYDPNPYHLQATFDNTGRETVGVLRGGLTFYSDSLIGYRDKFMASYSRAKSTDIAYSSYTFPIANRGTEIGGSFSFSNIKISSGPFEPLNIEGNSYNYSGIVSQQFLSTRRFDLSADLSMNFRQVTTFLDELPLFTTQVRSLVAGLTFVARDRYGRWYTRHEFANGLDLLGGNVRFFKYNGNVTRIHSFGHGIMGIFRAATQLTDDRLPPVEQFQLGGSGTVRGYTEGLLLGDNGYLFSAELRTPIPFLPKEVGKKKINIRDKIQFVLFVDHGGAFIDNWKKTHNDFLTSVGLGLRGSITKYVEGRLDYGFGLGQRETPQPTARLHFGLYAKPF